MVPSSGAGIDEAFVKNIAQPIPDSKVHGTNMGLIWSRQDPGGPHVGPINFVIWDVFSQQLYIWTWKHMGPS